MNITMGDFLVEVEEFFPDREWKFSIKEHKGIYFSAVSTSPSYLCVQVSKSWHVIGSSKGALGSTLQEAYDRYTEMP